MLKTIFDCIADRNPKTNASIEIGAHIAKFCHLGNIAYRTGEKLVWDGTKFTNSSDANSYLAPGLQGTLGIAKSLDGTIAGKNRFTPDLKKYLSFYIRCFCIPSRIE